MKKIVCIVIASAMLLTLFGCGGDNTLGSASVQQSSTSGVDLDLTQLSSTMVYSEVSNMMTTPDNYIGKTIKMNGKFAVYQDKKTKKYYFACLNSDATACCSQGIEFALKGDYSYPKDYPEVDTEITVQGIFNTYKEGDQTYPQLKDAVLL